MSSAHLAPRKAVNDSRKPVINALYARVAAAPVVQQQQQQQQPKKAPKDTTKFPRFAAGPSRNPADNFARRKAEKANRASIPAILAADDLTTRPQPTHTHVTLGFSQPDIAASAAGPDTLAAAIQFWRAWLTHPPLISLTCYFTPSFTTSPIGFYTLTDRSMILISAFWYALYESIADVSTLPAGLQRLIIDVPSAIYAPANGCIAVVSTATSPTLPSLFYYAGLANPTLAGSLVFSTIGCDSIGYKYRLSATTIAAAKQLREVALPPCFLSMDCIDSPRLSQELAAELSAVSRTLRFLFPNAAIRAGELTPYIPKSLGDAVEAEKAACVVNLRDMKLGRIRRIWSDVMRMMEG
jgi:hypothetical protein